MRTNPLSSRRAAVALTTLATAALVAGSVNVGSASANVLPAGDPTPSATRQAAPQRVPAHRATVGAATATAGVLAGSVLKPSGSLRITRDGTVIANLDVRGEIIVDADNVVIRNTRVTGSGWSIVRVMDGHTGVRLNHVDVDGLGFAGSAGSAGVFGPARIVASEIVGVENGVIPFTGSVIRNSYIHHLRSPGDDPHYDGIQTDGYQHHILIDHNTVDIRDREQTSAVMIDNDFGPESNVMVSNNYLAGGSFTVYSDGKFRPEPITDISFVNNKLGSGYYGYGLIRNTIRVTWTGNYDATTGKIVNPS